MPLRPRKNQLAALAIGVSIGVLSLAQNPAGTGGAPGNPVPGQFRNASAPSHVLQRGDREILTFESEQDYDRLQELLRQSQESKPESGRSIRYFRSAMDGAVQPYVLWRPSNMEAGKSYPLVVQLHGTNFNEVLSGVRTHFQGLGIAPWIEQDLPVVYIQCFGRGNTFYQGMGEQDILEAIEDTRRTLPIDADRIYIMGHSMGGAGSFTIGLHFPDRFAGIMPIDPAMWDAAARPEPGAEWMTAQSEIVKPSHLYTNARNVDVFFKNAGAGLQRKSTEFSDGIIERGGFSTTESFPRMPHNFSDQYPYANFITILMAHPVKKKPAVVNFETNTLRYNSAYWLTIDRLTRHNQTARIEASIDGVQAAPAGPRFGPQGGGPGGRPGAGPNAGPGGGQRPNGPAGAAKPALRVSTTNIDALTLRLSDSPLPKGAPITIDGQEITGPFAEVLHVSRQGGTWHAGEYPVSGIAKRHGLQGPIGDAFNGHFLAVYGEADRDLDRRTRRHSQSPGPPRQPHGLSHEAGVQTERGGYRLVESDPVRDCGQQPRAAPPRQIAACSAAEKGRDFHLSESGESLALSSSLERPVAERQRPANSRRLDHASQPAARLRLRGERRHRIRRPFRRGVAPAPVGSASGC